jgi:hypothetical protein
LDDGTVGKRVRIRDTKFNDASPKGIKFSQGLDGGGRIGVAGY